MLNKFLNQLRTNESNLNLLPNDQLRKMGLIYSIYRFVISVFLFLSSYAVVFDKNTVTVELPSFLHQTILIFYSFFSLLLLALFFVIHSFPRRQLGLGLGLDIVIISLLLYLSGAPDIQLIMLYVVVVAASFIMLAPYQAAIITLLAVIFVIYQQFFYAITNSISVANLGNALLLSLSFLGVGSLSFYIAQRLAKVEKIAAEHADEVAKLNVINQQVISTISHGVMVISKDLTLKLTNLAAVNLLDLKLPNNLMPNVNHDHQASAEFIEQLSLQHPSLYNWLNSATCDTPALFHYQMTQTDSMISKLRISSTPIDDRSLLIVIEDIRREQSSAQQLKLASLGQLTASIAHEIRNPLAAISQASQLLIEDVEYSRQQAQKRSKQVLPSDTHSANSSIVVDEGNVELYQMIYNQTKRVNRIIEDVLNLSRQTKPNLQIFPLEHWMQNFIKEHYSSHDVFLHSSCDPTIQFDVRQLEQILINLINNGLRYSSLAQPHAYVEIEITCRKNDVIIDVLDTGLGVKSADQASLFDPFFTTDSEGTGLGLYLSQAFTEANNARLVFVPEHDKTCFRLIIPRVT